MQTKKSPLKILYLGLIVLLITFIVSYFYKKGFLFQSSVELPVIKLPSSPAVQTYKSEKYKFSLSYPSGWKLTTSDLEEIVQSENIPDNSILFQLTGISDKGKFEVLVWKNLNKTSVVDWVRWYLHEEIDIEAVPKDLNYYFQGNSAIQFIAESEARKKPLQYIFVNHEIYVFELIFEKSDSAEKEYNQIIDSFQFLDKETIPNEATEIVKLLKENLAKKTGLPIDIIEVVEVVPVKWSDSSLGCPEEGKVYLQVITPGFKVTLKAKNTIFTYHTDLKKNVILCPES